MATSKQPPKRRRRRNPQPASSGGSRPQCAAITAKGKRCKRRAAEGADHCPVHLGAPVGRPAKLDDEVAGRLIEVLRMGGYAETAAAVAGISRQTFYNWLERGDPEGRAEADAPFREFRERVEAARAEGEARNVGLIARAASKDWKAAAWMLERQYPDRWAGPRGRGITSTVHPDDFAEGETSGNAGVVDDQVGPDGRPL